MIGLRFTLARLMALVLFLGVGLSTLRYRDEDWAAMILDAAVIAICITFLGAIVCEGKSHATWIGLVVFGWIDLVCYHMLVRPVGSLWVQYSVQLFESDMAPSGGACDLLEVILFGLAGAIVGRLTTKIRQRPACDDSRSWPDREIARDNGPMAKALRGVVHGRTVEQETEPDIEDGRTVEVIVRSKALPGPPPGWRPGNTETAAGMMAEHWTEEDDRILEEIERARHPPSTREMPE